jgi:hypothetical protein
MLLGGDPHTLLVHVEIILATMKSVLKFLKKLKIELPYDLTILLLNIHPKESESACNRNI